MVFRLRVIDALIEAQRTQTFTKNMKGLLESTLDKAGVVRMILRLPVKGRTRKPNSFLCNEYIEEIYKHVDSFLNVEDLMRNDLHSAELARRYHLEKVYDFRWT